MATAGIPGPILDRWKAAGLKLPELLAIIFKYGPQALAVIEEILKLLKPAAAALLLALVCRGGSAAAAEVHWSSAGNAETVPWSFANSSACPCGCAGEVCRCGDACPALSYADARALAIKENRPLCVWVGLPAFATASQREAL